MYTVQQVAGKLQTSASLVYALCSQGRIDHIRIGLGRGTIRISEQALEQLLIDSRASVRPIHKPSGLRHLVVGKRR